MEPLLSKLSAHFAVVAVVSGRPVDYLRHRLANAGATLLIGLYGMERAIAGSADTRTIEEAARWRPALEALAASAIGSAPTGVFVEHKGLAVTLHYRRAPELSGWVEEFARSHTGGTGLVWHPGKMSVEIRPGIGVDKGSVVEDLAVGGRGVCFVGDDRGDLPAFAALSRLRDSGGSTLAVAVDGPETPRELIEQADLVVQGPQGVLAFLDDLAAGA